MKVSELIEKLKAMPQDVKVMIVDEHSPRRFDCEVRDVIYNPVTPSDEKYRNTVELDNWPLDFLTHKDRLKD